MKFVVITTINSPTKTIEYLSKRDDLITIVVGDKKTPPEWEYPNIHYLSYDLQLKLRLQIINSIPDNHYSRKMIGYLVAIKRGATEIIDLDDDNLPMKEYKFPPFEGFFDTVESTLGTFINIYCLFSKEKIWPRGFPLSDINDSFETQLMINQKYTKVGIWQGLANGDPDVDAIFRLTNVSTDIEFIDRPPIIIEKMNYSPYNSQNTLTRRELFPLLYLPTTVTFRYTDILRSLVAQPIMHLFEYKLGFIHANVIQSRNVHNLLEDFKSEIPMYLSNNIIQVVSEVINQDFSISDCLYNAYKALVEEGVVLPAELTILELWLNDVNANSPL